MQKKRYAIVGTGSRSHMYIKAAAYTYKDCAELVAMCDTNQLRMDYYNRELQSDSHGNHPPVPTYDAADFEKMIAEQKPDVVILTMPDRLHHKYGCRAMELGCDVISEKPMTTDPAKCQAIIDTQKKTGRKYTVTFNYRYSPRNTKVKELLSQGIIGKVTTVNFEWLLDTSHGADYFRRWHRNKANSGGLMVHKATHHFDLVNWWLDSTPETVFGMGDLKFYGKINAEERGLKSTYFRAKGSEEAKKDPFALQITPGDRLDQLYFETEEGDGYIRDLNVFGDFISIEDNMSVMVRYKNNVVMNYTLCAHCPWEGYRIVFNGTEGRLEFNVVESGFTRPGEDMSVFGMREYEEGGTDRKGMIPEIIVQKMWQKPEVYTYEAGSGGHGGGDNLLLDHLFLGVKDDPFGLAADFHDGAQSILTGIGANISFATGQPVKVQDLIKF